MKQAADDIETEKDDETPNSEMIERMVEKLEGAQSQQKNLFLIIFQVGSWFCYPQILNLKVIVELIITMVCLKTFWRSKLENNSILNNFKYMND